MLKCKSPGKPGPAFCINLQSRLATVYVAVTITVTVVAFARFIGITNERAANTADSSANCCAANVTGDCATENSSGNGTD